MERYTPKTWAMAAVKDIISQQERESAQQELWDHILDHKDALLAAGFSREEAERQAIAAMGDPEETAKLLRRAHQPILTRLVQAARACCIGLAVIVALSMLFSLMAKDDLMPRWFEGKPYPDDQAWFFEQPVDDSILFRRVCRPEAALPIGDYTLRVDKAAVVQYADRWEVHLLTEFDGKYLWQDPPVIGRRLSMTSDGAVLDIHGTDPRGHRNGGNHFGWFYAEVPAPPDHVALELACEDRIYTLNINLRGGEVYEKAR